VPPQAAGQPDAAAPAAAAGGAPATPAAGAGSQRPVLRGVFAVLALIVLFAAGFAAYLFGLSSIPEARTQIVLYKTFEGELGQLTAPTGPAPEGSPVALLDIPQIGLRNAVVVEGTSSRDLTHGPGLVRSSVLPGQAGLSLIYGKAFSYGAPFAHLMQLNRGNLITLTTGQGTARYVVESFGTSIRPAPADAPNRLVLETAGPGLVPREAVQVSADMVGRPQPDAGGQPQITVEEVDMAWYPDALIPLLLWSQALLIVIIAATVAANRWSRGAAYLCAAPIVAALLWCVFENLATVLPNLY
jgi:sortase A